VTGTLYAGSLLSVVPAFAASERQTRVMLGTFIDIAVSDASSMRAQDAMSAAFAEAARLDALLSRYNSATPLAELNRAGRLNDAPAELIHVLNAAQQTGTATRGAFNATVQPVVDYLRAQATTGTRVHLDEQELLEVCALADPTALKVSADSVRLEKSGMGVTLDGIAKGYIADRMAAVLSAHGIDGYLVNAGGDIRAHGTNGLGKAWTVAVESPSKDGAYPATLALRGGAVATSGSYENRYDRKATLSHLVDPQTGLSPLSTVSVTVRASNAMRADALATALSVMAAPHAVQLADALPDCECFIVMRGGQKAMSRGWGRSIIG
jgi:thiamine biosynthesis lipoprotein